MNSTSPVVRSFPKSAGQDQLRRNRIFVRRLCLDAWIGFYEWEKSEPQPIMLDLECALPSSLACITDCIEHTVDYGALVERLRGFALEKPRDLVESLAEGMATVIQAEFGVPWLQLTLTKLAPLPGAEVGITIERGG